MPNFNGKGPLNRGRVIGRGRGPCKKGDPPREDESCGEKPETTTRQKTS